MEYSGAGGKLIHEKNQTQKISWHCPFKGSHWMGDGLVFLQISAPLFLINAYRINLISAGSISQDSTFKYLSSILFVIYFGLYHYRYQYGICYDGVL